LHGAGVVQW